MISHNEAQALISARQDQVLDPIAEHELSAHLATCDSCRAFARSTDSLTQGLRTLPYMPASPAVRRAVLDRVEQGRSPFARLGGMFEASPGPALSTLVIIALVALLGFFAFNRFVLQDQDGGDEGRQLASQPTEQAPATETPTFTVTPDVTETPVDLAAGETPEPTETVAPTAEPTDEAATEAPTEEPTEEPAPTETPAPTATTEPTAEPTAEPTSEPTEEPAGIGSAGEPTEEAADLTIASAEETVEPTATTEPTPEPTATLEPTEEPTEEPAPTATTEPTPEPTAEPTAEPTPEPTAEPAEETAPAIVPIDGSQPVDVPKDDQPQGVAGRAGSEEPTNDVKSSRTAPTIEPIDGETVNPPEGRIEQIDPDETPASEEAPETLIGEETPETTPEPESEAETTEDLADASQLYGDIAGEPGGRLVLTQDGRMVYGDQPHEPTMVTPAGRTLETIDAEGGAAVALCDAAGTCTDVSSESREGDATDTPLGIIGADVIYARETGGAVEYRRSAVEGSTIIADEVLYSGGGEDAPQGAVFFEGGRLWIPTTGGDWVMLSDTEGALLPGGYANPQLVRFADTGQGMLVGFVAEGQLVIAPAESPASPVLTLPFSGEDFDMAPGGDRVVVSTGSSIDIYDMGGSLLVSYSAPDIRPGTVLWLNSGIVYVNDESGALYQIPETGN